MKKKVASSIEEGMYNKVLAKYKNITATLPNSSEMFQDIVILLRYIDRIQQELGEAKSLSFGEHSSVYLEAFDESRATQQ